MSTLSQFLGGGVTTAIVNAHSAGGAVSSGLNNNGREVLSGALTAATPETLLTINGSGRVPLLSAYGKDATPRTVRLVVEVDGVSVFDATSSSAVGDGVGLYAAGMGGQNGGSAYLLPAEPIVFASSLVVKVASSLTETNKVGISYICYRT